MKRIANIGLLFAVLLMGNTYTVAPKIMFVGDSISKMQLMPDEWHGHFKEMAAAAGMTISGLGQYSDAFGGFTSINLTQIVTCVPPPPADIILQQSGTNERGMFTYDMAGAETNRATLIQNLRIKYPNALILVAPIPPVNGEDNTKLNQYNAWVKSWVTYWATFRNDAKLKNMPDFAPGDWPASRYQSDNIHPNEAGLLFLSQRWMDAIQANYP